MQSDRELREQQHIPYMPLSACLSLYSNRLVTCYLASLRSRVEFVDYLGRRRGGAERRRATARQKDGEAKQLAAAAQRAEAQARERAERKNMTPALALAPKLRDLIGEGGIARAGRGGRPRVCALPRDAPARAARGRAARGGRGARGGHGVLDMSVS